MEKHKQKQSTIMTIVKSIPSFIGLTVGASCAAAALEIFLIPNSMIDGGLTGISIILNKLLGGSLGLFILILNIPFLIIGFRQIGKKFLVKASFAIIVFTSCLTILSGIEEVTEDIILATVYGGLLLGIGVGLVIKSGGCLDGTEVIAILVSKKNSLSVGQVVLFFNIFIYGSAIFVFGPDRALYSLLTYFITFKVIDMVSEGMEQAKGVFIITDKSEDISATILEKMGRNVTILNGEGLMTHPEKVMLYVVITRLELPELRDIIDESDSSSFVSVTDISEIMGPHIKMKPKELKQLKNNE